MIKYNSIVFKDFDFPKYIFEEINKEDSSRIFLYLLNNNCEFVHESTRQIVGDFAVKLESYLDEPNTDKFDNISDYVELFRSLSQILEDTSNFYDVIGIITRIITKLNYSIENTFDNINYFDNLNYQNRTIILMCSQQPGLFLNKDNKGWDMEVLLSNLQLASAINAYQEDQINEIINDQFYTRYYNYALSFYGEITNKENFTKKAQLFSILDNLTTQNQCEFIDMLNILSDFMQVNELSDNLISEESCLIYPWDKYENLNDLHNSLFMQRVEISKVIKRWFGENILR